MKPHTDQLIRRNTMNFSDFLFECGLGLHQIIYDGQIHRIKPRDGKSKSAWYVAFIDSNFESGAAGDWCSGLKETFNNIEKQDFTKEQKKQYTNQMKLVARQTAADIKRRNTIATQECIERWSKANSKGMGSHSYCKRKQIKALNTRIDNKGNLLIPIYDNNINLCNIQSINSNGGKYLAKGAKIKRCYHPIGFENRRPPIIILCEGYATGISIFLATYIPVIVCFNASNLPDITPIITRKYNNSQLIIAGDDDQFNQINIGKNKAELAAKSIGATTILPIFKNLSTEPTDFNDLHCLEGLDAVNKQIMEVCNAL